MASGRAGGQDGSHDDIWQPLGAAPPAPGEVAATTSTKGPQFLFGDATLKVKARIDMIEWDAEVTEK